jgi:hypothetical protein
MAVWMKMCTFLSFVVPATSQRLLARREHVSDADFPVALSRKVNEAEPPSRTSAPYLALKSLMVHVWFVQVSASKDDDTRPRRAKAQTKADRHIAIFLAETGAPRIPAEGIGAVENTTS